MLFHAPKYGYLPADQVRRISRRYDDWMLVDADGQTHSVASPDAAVIWPPIAAHPGWLVVNAWHTRLGDKVELQRLPVIAWRVGGDQATPVLFSQFAEVWALQADSGGRLLVPNERTLADDMAFVAFARERYAELAKKVVDVTERLGAKND